jgi:hypothetical protein
MMARAGSIRLTPGRAAALGQATFVVVLWFLTIIRITREVWAETQDLRREALRRYPSLEE